MLNAERFKEEINKHNNEFGLTDSIADCKTLGCRNCRFSRLNNSDDEIILCSTRKVKWLLSEYKEPVKLTRFEYEILKYVQKEGFNFIIRNNYGDLSIHKTKPIKPDGSIDWCITGESYVLCAFNDLFKLVKFEDKEPTSIQEVLENCAVENIKEEQ